MWRTMLLWLGLLGLGVVSLAAPKIGVDQASWDFGEVVEGMLVEHAFVLTNLGDVPLVFTHNPTTTCGCTVAALPKKVLQPGESIELEVTFDSTGYGGHYVRKGIYVFTNDPQTPELHLYITGYVKRTRPYQFSARYLAYDFYILVDIRSQKEYEKAHLLGAVNIPAEELKAKLELLPPGALIYLYDADGKQAPTIVQELIQRYGRRFARAIEGGLSGWIQDLGYLFVVRPEVAPLSLGAPSRAGRYTVKPRYVAAEYIVLLDLRSAEEFAAEHFPGAINLTPAELPQWVAQNLPRPGDLPQGTGYRIWCLDDNGTSACASAEYLRSQGYPAVCVVGGLAQWFLRYGDTFFWHGGKEGD